MNTTADKWPWETPPPGIYFNMPFEEYLDIPCLQSSTIKNLLIDPTKFWHNSWMNPHRDQFRQEKKAYMEGTAYHMRILEGRDKFDRHYACDHEIDKDDPTILVTSDDIKTALRNHKQKVSFTNKADGIRRLLSVAPHSRVFDQMVKDHRAQFEGKEFLDPVTYRTIEYTAKCIESSPHLSKYFAGGYPEVTIIFDCPITGLRFKIRPDYLKVGPVTDLKSYANMFDEQPKKACTKQISRRMYHIQARLYLHGVNIAKAFVKSGQVFGADHVNPQWLSVFSDTPAEEFWLCFVEKGDTPVANGLKMTLRDKDFDDVMNTDICRAADVYKQYHRNFGHEFWPNMEPDEYVSMSELWR